ncbi:MAG: pyruvate dehydrogenase complex dihydrolipoamide acetyltransferase [Opitutales bacterium]|nr:pyruvate dehydrogenase complex dihydrolipoamide acetyltransferase [Opitutales bacterium]NRA28249.1 pyruvate dehydrogenase complex dihydrolipoamide acetyltransferase [Opitutales bacterium]
MATIIEMPKLSDTMTVGTLVTWLKKEGDPVASGDMIAEVETDKATMEVENFEDGIILKVYVAEGEQVDIGAPICAIGEKGEDIPEVGTSSSAPKTEAAEETPKEASASPAPTAPEPTTIAATTQAPSSSDSRVKASPLAKKIAAEKGIDLASITGSGPNGRIVKADVENTKPIPASETAAAPAPVIYSGAGIQEAKSVPVSNMRGTIARRLLESKTQIPHFYLSIEVNATALIKFRGELNAGLESQGVKLTVNDLILKAATEALRRVPSLNASWMGDHIQYHDAVNMAFAVPIPDGLLTPTIMDAHLKSIRTISQEAKALIKKTQAKKLTPAEMSNHTFTVSNMGMPRLGISNFFGIINPPDAAILCVGASVAKPVISPKGDVVPGQIMNLALCCDHRVVDGADGAEFLSSLRDILETPALILA